MSPVTVAPESVGTISPLDTSPETVVPEASRIGTPTATNPDAAYETCSGDGPVPGTKYPPFASVPTVKSRVWTAPGAGSAPARRFAIFEAFVSR